MSLDPNSQVGHLAVAAVSSAAAVLGTPIVTAYAKAHGVEISTPEQLQAVQLVLGIIFGSGTQKLGAIVDALTNAVVALTNALANRGAQALNLVGYAGSTSAKKSEAVKPEPFSAS